MKREKIFNFLTRFAAPRDVKVVMENKKIDPFNILSVAWRLWRGVPVAKIINKKWFYGLPFYTDRHTLDPRPDSETLIDAVLKDTRGQKIRILDLGTGTGCLLCALIKNMPGAVGIGIDRSRRARIVARRNVRDLGLEDRIKIVRGTFRNVGQGFDIVVSNPPYIAEGDVVDRGARHDPGIALYGGRDGLKYYREIARIKTAAKIYVEIGAGQEKAVREIFAAAGRSVATGYKDLSGIVRVLAFS